MTDDWEGRYRQPDGQWTNWGAMWCKGNAGSLGNQRERSWFDTARRNGIASVG
jgi:hypothetical protein